MVTVEYERPVESVEDLGDAALVTAVDGAVYRAEALVGADGPFSRGIPRAPRRRPPGIRALPDAPDVRGAGRRRRAAPLVVARPARHARRRAGRSRGRLGDRAPRRPRRHGPDAVDDVVARLLDGTCPEVRAATTGAAPAVTDVRRHHAPLDRPTRHRMTVVGAAAQPVLPHTAQSASQALLDAGALGRAFDRADGRIAPRSRTTPVSVPRPVPSRPSAPSTSPPSATPTGGRRAACATACGAPADRRHRRRRRRLGVGDVARRPRPPPRRARGPRRLHGAPGPVRPTGPVGPVGPRVLSARFPVRDPLPRAPVRGSPGQDGPP